MNIIALSEPKWILTGVRILPIHPQGRTGKTRTCSFLSSHRLSEENLDLVVLVISPPKGRDDQNDEAQIKALESTAKGPDIISSKEGMMSSRVFLNPAFARVTVFMSLAKSSLA